MASHAHLVEGSPELHLAARAALTAQGVQWTGLRALVFGCLADRPGPSSAYDIAEDVSRVSGKRVAANSVYRILDLFVTANLAKRIESRSAYVANVHPACAHDCIFLVCEGCGGITHLDDDRLADAMRATASASGFAPARPVMEIIGRCGACSAAAA